MGPLGYAIGGVGTATSVGFGLFNYNRGNFRMDQKLHYARFCAGHNMAIAQTKQYREDLVDLSTLTCTRMDCYHAVAAMSLTILTALFCPGRLGLHTPAPPGWLMGLFLVNLGGCYLWLGLTMWLAMHASMRADTAVTHMLTRFVRLPIPNTYMLDRARKFLANVEEVPLSEILRFPFTKHQAEGKNNQGGFNIDPALDDDEAKARTRRDYDLPAWYRKEKQVDEHSHNVESMMPYNATGNAPEHFEVYREIQNEWWPYDVYARICIFLAHMHLFHAWSYHQIGHGLQETRALFAVGTVVIPMSVLQQMIITLDIVPNYAEFPLHRIGPIAPLLAYVAGAIEYMRWYSQEVADVGYILVYICYIIHIVYTYQLIRLCRPSVDKPPMPAEADGAAWWPGEWTLPAAFQHAVWLVAPPKNLSADQHDLAGEMRRAGKKAGDGYSNQSKVPESVDDDQKRRDVHNALGPHQESPAWQNVRWGLIAMLIAWVWLTFGFTIELFNQGTTHPSLLSAPGLPNNARDPRWRPPKPGREHAVEIGTGGIEKGPFAGERHGEHHAGGAHASGGEHGHGGSQAHGGAHANGEEGHGPSEGHAASGEHATDAAPVHAGVHRRLSGHEDLAAKVRALLPHLRELADGAAGAAAAVNLGQGRPSSALGAMARPMAALPPRVAMQWPPLFEPRLLACGPAGRALLLSHYGRGAEVEIPVPSAHSAVPSAAAAPFSLEGLANFGTLVAGSWDDAGLLLLTATGIALECPGHGPKSGRWRCQPVNAAKLPLGQGGQHFAGAAAIARRLGGSAALRAAVIQQGEELVTLYTHADGLWLPSGEARVGGGEHSSAAVVAATFDDDDALLLTSRDGALTRMSVVEGRASLATPAMDDSEGHVWQATCGLASGAGFAHLALRPSAAGLREPTLLLGASNVQ